MKFGTLLELNSNIEWWNHYVDYDALKKLFPSNPLDPSYLSTQESTSLLPTTRQDKYATPDEFRVALDREKDKVTAFYKGKLADLRQGYRTLEDEVAALEDRELGGDDVIKEENSDEEDDEPSHPNRPLMKKRESIINRLGSNWKRRRSVVPTNHEADIMEASIPSLHRSLSASQEDEGSPSRARQALPRRHRQSSEVSDDDRRASMSSTSSHEHEIERPRQRWQSLGLVEMDEGVYMWTGSNDHATVMRIGFKKRISAVWLEAYALKQYVDLNLTAFEKILKKYDKNTNSKLKKQYVANDVQQSTPWTEADRADLDDLLERILLIYRRVVTSGDEDVAKEQLRSQLREKVVVDRETVWSQMVTGHREGIFRSVEPDLELGTKIKTPFGKFRLPSWFGTKGLIFGVACAVLAGVVIVQPFDRVEESNCLAMLVFCTILWASEAIPLFVTSLSVPLLVVFLRVLRSSDEADTRLSAPDATKYIFSQMFNPTIMLLIGGFTIAAVLSKTRLDVMTASRVLNAAGTHPSVVLLVLMCVATFASMWISNVAAPTLCYALIKPITNELPPKSVFSRALIIAIALAANIGGQASPISSPQNLIALSAMETPLSWLEWFAISIPVSTLSVVVIWAFLHVNYRWEADLRIPRMRKNTDSLTRTHWFVLCVSGATIGLWCVEKQFEGVVGDMGVIALIPLLAFFGTGILSKEDFHSFHWSIVFLAMGGIALGKATLSSGLLDDLDSVLERLVEGMGLYSILLVFSALALVIATFISHTIAAVLLVPIATRIGESLDEPHPRLLIMATALICSAGMGLPVSGFPNMTAITQENKLGNRFIGATDFLKNGIPASILATFVIVTIGYAIMRALQL